MKNIPIPNTEVCQRVYATSPGFDPDRGCFVAPSEAPMDVPLHREGPTTYRGKLIVQGWAQGIDPFGPLMMSPALAALLGVDPEAPEPPEPSVKTYVEVADVLALDGITPTPVTELVELVRPDHPASSVCGCEAEVMLPGTSVSEKVRCLLPAKHSVGEDDEGHFMWIAPCCGISSKGHTVLFSPSDGVGRIFVLQRRGS